MESIKVQRCMIGLIIIGVFFSGCATIIKEYEDSVRIVNAPDSLRVFDNNGNEITINRSFIVHRDGDYSLAEIKLRSNQNHTLNFKNQNKEKIITIYPKLGFGWVLLDLLCGGIPTLYDAYTGNWNKFSDIEDFDKK